MPKFKKEFKSFIDDIEKNVKNREDLEYIKDRTTEFLNTILEEMEGILSLKEEKIAQIEQTQKELDERMGKMQQVIDNIEQDIYSEDGFDFEIVCPYCDYEFVIDANDDKTEIECPKCKNIIELDWSGNSDAESEECCDGHCSHCTGCDDAEKEDQDDDM